MSGIQILRHTRFHSWVQLQLHNCFAEFCMIKLSKSPQCMVHRMDLSCFRTSRKSNTGYRLYIHLRPRRLRIHFPPSETGCSVWEVYRTGPIYALTLLVFGLIEKMCIAVYIIYNGFSFSFDPSFWTIPLMLLYMKTYWLNTRIVHETTSYNTPPTVKYASFPLLPSLSDNLRARFCNVTFC